VKPKFRIVPIAQLVLDDMNANKGTKRGRDLLKKSLGKYGAGPSGFKQFLGCSKDVPKPQNMKKDSRNHSWHKLNAARNRLD
jgi:hypothetical protein